MQAVCLSSRLWLSFYDNAAFCSISACVFSSWHQKNYKIHSSYKKFCNFVLGEHSDCCLYHFVIGHYKVATVIANHQTYRQF